MPAGDAALSDGGAHAGAALQQLDAVTDGGNDGETFEQSDGDFDIEGGEGRNELGSHSLPRV